MEDFVVASGYDGINVPYSLEAEQSVLGAVLLDSTCFDRVAEILPIPECFHVANHQLIYAAMLDMFTIGTPIDFVTVLEKLQKDESFDEATGKTYLMQLVQIVPAVSMLKFMRGL